MVTQTAAGQQPAAKHTNKTSVWKEAAAAAAAAPLGAASSYPSQHQEGEPSSVHAPAQANTGLPSSQESTLPGLPPLPPAEAPQLQAERSPRQQGAPDETEPSSQPASVNPDANKSPCSQILDFQLGAEEPSPQTEQLKSSNIDDILKRVIEEEREKAERARAAAKTDGQSDDVLRVTLHLQHSLKECCHAFCWAACVWKIVCFEDKSHLLS